MIKSVCSARCLGGNIEQKLRPSRGNNPSATSPTEHIVYAVPESNPFLAAATAF